jgi:8-oxo-dGTP pyrophosphatase MutT (NUDIX family)
MQRQENSHSSRHRLNKSAARAEHSAGGVAYRRVGRRVFFGLIKDSYHKWTLPKGHLEKGETSAQAALRETHEEMGLKRLRLVAPLGGISISFKDRYVHVGQTIHKRIDFFLMETAAHERGVPEGGEGIAAIRWVPYRVAARLAGYKNVQPILRAASAFIDRENETAKNRRLPLKNNGKNGHIRP